MIWFLSNWKLVGSATIISILMYFSFSYGEDRVQQEWDKEKATLVKAIVVNGQVVHDLGVSHDKDQILIDKLAADNHALWLRLPKTTCIGLNSPTTSGQAIAGVEPLPVEPQQALNRYTEGVGSLMHEADSIVNDCRVVMEWAKTLEKK